MVGRSLLIAFASFVGSDASEAQPAPEQSLPEQPNLQQIEQECANLRTQAGDSDGRLAVAVQEDKRCRLVNKTMLDRLVEQSTSGFLDHLGVGLSLTVDTGTEDRVDGATIVDGIVRIDEDSNVRPRFVGEIHFALACQNPALIVDGRKRCDPTERSSGLFLAVQPGSNNIVEAVGAGWMWRLPDKLFDRALNIGIGVMIDENVRILGDGIEVDQPLPAGETEIRMRTTDQTGLLFIASIEVGAQN